MQQASRAAVAAAMVGVVTGLSALAGGAGATTPETGVVAKERVYVPDSRPNMSSEFKYRPKLLHITTDGQEDVTSFTFRPKRWVGWGASVAKASGKFRVCEGDYGCKSYQVTIKLSRPKRSGCGDIAVQAYSRLSFGRIGTFTRRSTVISPLVSC